MRIDPRLRLEVREQLSDTRRDSRYVTACIPTLTTGSGFDPDTQSGLDITSGDGTGQTVASWLVYRIRAHIRPVDANLIAYQHIPPGVIDGDVFFGVQPRDKAPIESAYKNKDAYVYIDGETYRVISFISTGIGQVEQWAITCQKTTPLYRAPGY